MGTKDGWFYADRLHRSAADAHGGLAVDAFHYGARPAGAVARRCCRIAPTSPNAYTQSTPRWALLAVSSAARTSWRESPTWRMTRRWLACWAPRPCPASRPSRGFSALCRSAGESPGRTLASRTAGPGRDGYTPDLDSFSLIHEDGLIRKVRGGLHRGGPQTLPPAHRGGARGMRRWSPTFGCDWATPAQQWG